MDTQSAVQEEKNDGQVKLPPEKAKVPKAAEPVAEPAPEAAPVDPIAALQAEVSALRGDVAAQRRQLMAYDKKIPSWVHAAAGDRVRLAAAVERERADRMERQVALASDLLIQSRRETAMFEARLAAAGEPVQKAMEAVGALAALVENKRTEDLDLLAKQQAKSETLLTDMKAAVARVEAVFATLQEAGKGIEELRTEFLGMRDVLNGKMGELKLRLSKHGM